MNRQQKIAIGALPVLAVSMTLVYRALAHRFGRQRAWYLGFPVYWLVWGISLPFWLLGDRKLFSLFAFPRPTRLTWVVVILPSLFSLLGRNSTRRERATPQDRVVRVVMTLVNGTLEEVLWRGVYVTLFPDNKWWSLVYPTLWFALWHYAPGSVSPLTDVRMLMTGAAAYGALLGWSALRNRSIGWEAASHVLAGLIQVSK